jgi:hypothetical protein
VGTKTLTVPVELTVYSATVPQEESLKIVQGYHMGVLAKYHGVEYGSEDFYALDAEYIKALRRMRQNMTYVGGVKVTEVDTNKYEFDFSEMEKTIRRQLSQGIKYFNGPSIGWRQSWKLSTILVN